MDVLAVVLIVSILIAKGDAWWQDLDCQVTEWTAWSEPYGFGQISRERKILRYPTGTGKPCPDEMLQDQFPASENAPNTTVQAKHFKNEFFRFYNQHNVRTKRQSPVGELRDLLVILDNSGSIRNGHFSNAKTQIGRLLELLCPQPDPFDTGYQQVAFITFSGSVQEIFQFDSYTGISAIKSAVNRAPYIGGSTCTAAAFRYVDDMFQSTKGARKRQGVKQEVLIITDGQSNCGGNAIAEALKAHEIADVFGLMVGDFDSSGREEVTKYVSKPTSKHLFYLNSFAEIETFVNTIKSELQEYNAPCAPFDFGP